MTAVRSGLLVVLALVAASSPGLSQEPEGQAPKRHTGAQAYERVMPLSFDGDLRTLPPVRAWRRGDPIREIPKRVYNRKGVDPHPRAIDGLDPVTQSSVPRRASSDLSFASPVVSFLGIPYNGRNPPDPSGAAGPVYFIQALNGDDGTDVVVWDKTGTSVASFSMSDLTPSPGDPCHTDAAGDPIVLFDELAQRWLLSEFTWASDHLCVYISKTPDPVTGGFWSYRFATPDFPDYPKFGVWPGAYFAGTNESDPALYAFERDKMLEGLPAGSQRFIAPGLEFAFQSLLPADFDGTIDPPAGAPGLFGRHNDDESHSGSPNSDHDYFELFEVQIDWDTPANSTLTGPFSIEMAEFDSDLCGLNDFSCVPQPGFAQLDPIQQTLMFRFQYRRSEDHETLVATLTTDLNGTDQHGVRWLELRDSGTGWQMHQQGSLLDDGTHRWLSSAAMDQYGNLAIGYNASSDTVFPSLRYTGQRATAPLGVMSEPEYELATGFASNLSSRYGDYSEMTVDPADDCTFWFTGMYNPSSQWATWITALQFDGCGDPMFMGGFESGDTSRWSAAVP